MTTASNAPATKVEDRTEEQARQEWTDAVTAEAWRRWDAQMSVQATETTTVILQAAQIAPGMKVLEIATGTGEPLPALSRLVGPTGHITATDISPGMLAIAEEKAGKASLDNVSFRQADVHALPFTDNSFDRVTCRFGVMLFDDAPHALREIYRVLNSGGRASFVAWGQLRSNPMMLASMGPILKRVQVPPPVPGAPGAFKYATPGSLSVDLRCAGFKHVEEETCEVAFPWPGTPESLWERFKDIAIAYRPLIEGLSPEEKESAVNEVLDSYRRFYDGQQINMTASIIVASGVK